MSINRDKLTEEERVQRELLVKTAGIPETCSYSIVVPPNEDMNGFFRKAYHEDYCKEYISAHEFNEIVDNACKLASLAYSKKRQNDNRQLSPKVVFVFWICTIFVISFCFLSYYAAIEKSNEMRIISIALLATSTVVFSVITLSIIFAKIPEFPTLHELVKSRIDSYFNNINQIYIKKGFWWRIAPELLYIEMVIEDKIPQEVKNNMSDVYIDPEEEEEMEEKKKEAEKKGSSTRRSKKNQVLPMKDKKDSNEKDKELSRVESAYNTYENYLRKASRSRMNDSKRMKSEEDIGYDQPSPDTGAKNKFKFENPMDGQAAHNPKEDNFEGANEMMSPEQRLNKSPNENEATSPQIVNNIGQNEDSLKMEDVLSDFEKEDGRVPNRKQQPTTAVYSSKNQGFGFGEQENSNFGTEWMSDKNK